MKQHYLYAYKYKFEFHGDGPRMSGLFGFIDGDVALQEPDGTGTIVATDEVRAETVARKKLYERYKKHFPKMTGVEVYGVVELAKINDLELINGHGE